MVYNFALGDDLEAFVEGMIATGRYASASEVVRDGLRLVEERERVREAKLKALRGLIQDGFDSGPAAPLDMAGLRERARHDLAKGGSSRG